MTDQTVRNYNEMTDWYHEAAHQRDTLAEALREAEWGGSRWIGLETCPVCGAERPEGHTAGCSVRAALAGLDAPV